MVSLMAGNRSLSLSLMGMKYSFWRRQFRKSCSSASVQTLFSLSVSVSRLNRFLLVDCEGLAVMRLLGDILALGGEDLLLVMIGEMVGLSWILRRVVRVASSLAAKWSEQ